MSTPSNPLLSFAPPLVLSSLSGSSDTAWARAGSRWAGGAFLGGIALDERSRGAARKLVSRDRDEFLPPDPFAFIDAQLEALEDVPIQPGWNVRSTRVGPIVRAARRCHANEALLEINAHCRQAELCAVGCGEALLADASRLERYVDRASETGATVGIKVRAEVPGVDLPTLCQRLEHAGAAFVHVDAMDSESVIGAIVDACDLFVIANNGVRDDATVQNYLEFGADAVSVGRPSTDPVVLERVRDALETVDGTADRIADDQPTQQRFT